MPTKKSLKSAFRQSKLTGQLSVVLFSLLFLAVVATLGVVIFSKLSQGVKKSVLASQTVRLAASADAAVSSLAPTANTGSSQILELKRAGTSFNDEYAPSSHALIKFDLSQIPTGSTITEAKLKLYVNSLVITDASPMARVGLFAGKTSSFWGENTVNYSNSPGTDGDIAEVYYLPTGYTGLVTLDVTSQVADWLSGNYPNDGFYVFSDTVGNSYDMKLASREAGSAGPLLGIVYETSGLILTQYPSFNSDLLSQLTNLANSYQNGQMPDFSGLGSLVNNSQDWEQAMRDFMSQFENFTPPDPMDSVPPNGGLPTGAGWVDPNGGTGAGQPSGGSGQNSGQERDCTTLALTSQPSVSLITDTGAVISWQTDNPSDSYVFYTTTSTNSTNPSDYQGMGFSDTGVTNHIVTLADLLPDTEYFYRAGSTCVGDVFAMSDATQRFYTTGGAGTTSADANGGDLIDGGAVPPPGWRQDLPDHGASLTTGAGTSGMNTSNGSNEPNGSNTTSGRLAGSFDTVSGHAIPSFGNSRPTSSSSATPENIVRFLPVIIGGVVIGGAVLTIVIVIVLVLILSKKKKTVSSKSQDVSKTKAVTTGKTSDASTTTTKSSSTTKIIAGCCGCGCLLLIFVFVILPLIMSFGPFTPFGFFSLFRGGL